MEIALLLFFILLLLLIFLYSLTQLNLLVNYLRNKNSAETDVGFDHSLPKEVPFVTVQLPVYNEGAVVERLLRNISQLEYPKDKLEIQVLDDSTDESVFLISRLVSELREGGLDIHHLRRSSRVGFKAGALKEGLETAKGEFIAIFDSDFLPGKDWLQQTIPYFRDEEIGVVQTRWGHLNRDYSMLTNVQAFALDFHFILEQNGRNIGKHFINFNGTAGVWRKQCILDAGNWEGDTLTEDLDLSYRAQLRNWKFKYLESVETPAELPVTIEAARSQQFRWNKGAAENFQKNFRRIFTCGNLSLGTKIHSFFHLLNSSLFLLVLCLAVLSVPVLFVISRPGFSIYVNVMSVLGISSLIFFFCYWISFRRTHGGSLKNFVEYILMFFTFFSVAMGFSLHNSRAVLEGHLGKRSDFIRTPKFNISDRKSELRKKKKPVKLSGQFLLEILLMLYFGFAVYAAFELSNYSFILFHLMLFFGFGFLVIQSLKGITEGARFTQNLKGFKNLLGLTGPIGLTPLLILLSCCAFYFSFAYDLQRTDFYKLLGLYLGLFFLSWKFFQLKKTDFNLLIGVSILFRLLFLFSIPNLSQDFFRFLWDGKLILSGINPYLYTPDSLMAAGEISFRQAGELVSGMGSLSSGNHSNYPPLNQLLFAFGALFTGKNILGGVIAIRCTIIAADLGILYFGRKLLRKLNLPENRIFWYLLNPFVIIELTGNLHFEGVMVFFLISSLYLLHKGKWLWSALLFSLAVSTKLIPLLFLPLLLHYFYRRKETAIPSERGLNLKKLSLYYLLVGGITAASFLPFLSPQLIDNYLQTVGLWFGKFEFNASFYYLIRWIGFQTEGYNVIGVVGKYLGLLVFLIVLGLSALRRNKTTEDLITSMLFGISAYLFLATTVHPWYLVTPLVLSIFTSYRFPLAWSILIVLSYFAYTTAGAEENLWLVALEYLVLFGFLGYELFNRKRNKKEQARQETTIASA